MRFSYITALITLCSTLVLYTESAQARGWRSCRGPVYYQPAPVVYYQHQRPHYPPPPPQYYQQPYSSRPSNAPARATTTIRIGAADNYFEPGTVNVQPGTTVRWVNNGKHKHTVTSNDDLWDSGDLAPGATYSVTFTRPGTYYYYCRHHTNDKMQGTIVVGNGTVERNGSARSPGY